MSSLRPYQQECLDAILRDYQAGTRQLLCVLSTGTGKTHIAAHLPEMFKDVLPGKLLFIAHREEILFQTIEKFHDCAPHLKVGLEKAEHHADIDCDVIVACNASIGREGSTRMERFDWDSISIIVCDEAHRVLGQTFLNILEDSGVLKEGSRKLLVGLTATPRRTMRARDKQQGTLLDDEDLISLKSVFKKITFSFPIRKAVKAGFLVPPAGFRISTQTSLDDVKTVGGDFQIDSLSEAVNTPTRNALIVDAWKKSAEGRRTAAFTCTVQHAKDLAEVFMHNGVLAQPIWGEDPQRNQKLQWLNEGKVTVLCNCALLCEGWDSPSVSCIIQARPTKSSTLFTQIVGRGLRLYPGKTECVVLDVVDNYKRCNLMTLPSLLGLNPAFDLHGKSLVEAVEKIEELQEKNPAIDFSTLTDLSKVKAHIEALDLFSEPYTEEVKQFSELTWMNTADGAYMLAIPEEKSVSDARQFWAYKHEKLRLAQNELDEWVFTREAAGEATRELGIFNSLEEALRTADEVIRRCRPNRVKLLQRHATWHDATASDASKRYLQKVVGKKRTIAYCTCSVGAKCSGVPGTICQTCNKQQMSAGQVALAINKYKAKGSK